MLCLTMNEWLHLSVMFEQVQTWQLLQVGFYQIAKLCNIPFVCVMEYFLYTRRLPVQVVCSITLVMIGVGLVTISDVAINFPGLAVAMLSVVAAGSLLHCSDIPFSTLNTILRQSEVHCRVAWQIQGGRLKK